MEEKVSNHIFKELTFRTSKWICTKVWFSCFFLFTPPQTPPDPVSNLEGDTLYEVFRNSEKMCCFHWYNIILALEARTVYTEIWV